MFTQIEYHIFFLFKGKKSYTLGNITKTSLFLIFIQQKQVLFTGPVFIMYLKQSDLSVF